MGSRAKLRTKRGKTEFEVFASPERGGVLKGHPPTSDHPKKDEINVP